MKATIVTPEPRELDEAAELLKSLIRIDTSNPPGNEKEAIELLRWYSKTEGYETTVIGPNQDRPNLVARLAADPINCVGPPLILSCHVDTVPADPSRWVHPPLSGDEEGGYIWGRGAIDMKGFAAMAFTMMRLIKRRRLPITRDLIFVAVSDEEAGTDLGSKWLVDMRPDLLGGNPEYVINEVGGFSVTKKGHRFYPVQVAEKGIAWLKLTVEGPAGHSSLPWSQNSVVELARCIKRISSTRLPWHASKVTKRYIRSFASPLGVIAKAFAPLMTNPLTGPGFLPIAIPDPSQRAAIEAVLRNTATPTLLGTEGSINMTPPKASVAIDGRLAPGQTGLDLVNELYKILGTPRFGKYHIEVLRESPAVEFSTDTLLYEHIKESMRARDPKGHVIPSIVPGFTDSKNYAKLGATCYGFYPLQLPPHLDFAALFHGDNERIPVEGFRWGIETLAHLLSRFLTC